MHDFVQFTGPAILLLYLIISANFVGDTFGCRLKTLLQKGALAKHVLAYLLCFFFIVAAQPGWIAKFTFPQLFYHSAIYYLVFVLTTRMPFRITMVVLLLFIVSFYIDLYKRTVITSNVDNLFPLSTQGNLKSLQHAVNVQSVTLSLTLFFIFVGFIIYFRNKQVEFSSKFDIINFFSPHHDCKNDKMPTIETSLKNLIKKK